MEKTREHCDVKPFVVIIQKSCNGVTHPSIEHVEKVTQEGPDCNSQR